MALAFWQTGASAAETLKVICAARAEKPPVIDGRLDDPCWRKTEVRTDFVAPSGEPVPMKRASSMRMVYDDKNLYIGLQFFWDDVSILKKGVAEIIKKCGKPDGGISRNYVSQYGVELFLDPGASEVNYYQILFNVAGQMIGHFKMHWDLFKGGPYFKSAIAGNCCTFEFVYPFENLKPGNEWGFNICRDDENYYSIWKQMNGPFNEPRNFARLVIGDYRAWWDAVWGRKVLSELRRMESEINILPESEKPLKIFYAMVNEQVAEIMETARKHPPENRENFEVLYLKYRAFKGMFDSLETWYQTYELINTCENRIQHSNSELLKEEK